MKSLTFLKFYVTKMYTYFWLQLADSAKVEKRFYSQLSMFATAEHQAHVIVSHTLIHYK